MANRARDIPDDPLISEQAAEAGTPEQAPTTDLPETSTGKEFTVLEIRPGSGQLILAAGGGSMFAAEGIEGASKGDIVRVSYSETDENGLPVNAKATSIKS